jgi:hypothetical protein
MRDCRFRGMDDAVDRYRAASEANDIAALEQTLAADVELVSPLAAGGVFRGRDDVRCLLGEVYGLLRGLRWEQEIGDGTARVVIGEARVGPLRLSDAMVFDLGADGRIRRIRPHLRPWLATTLFALLLVPRLTARHPGVVWRLLRG